MCKTTGIALHPDQYTVFPHPDQCPVNGFEGSWYTIPFKGVPIYNRGNEGVTDTISWAAIDQWALIVANVWVTTGACLGLCLAVLAYIIALTPNKKRGLPFHTGLMLALVFEIARLLCDLGRASTSGMSPYSAYLGLTTDLAATTYTTSFRALDIAGMVCAILAAFFTFFCLYIQAVSLLSGVHLRWPVIYVGIMSYLLTGSALAMALRITIVVVQALYTAQGGLNNFPVSTFHNLLFAGSIAFAVAFVSWLSISSASVFWLMFTRSKLIISNRLYDTALTILSLVFMESMIVPVVFIILQTLPSARFPLAELVVLPSILVLLPMGSLFMTMHSIDKEAPDKKEVATPLSSPHTNGPGELESRPLVVSGQPVESYRLKTFNSPIERELEAIDKMDSAEQDPFRVSSNVDTILIERAAIVRRNLDARSITAASSKVEVG